MPLDADVQRFLRALALVSTPADASCMTISERRRRFQSLMSFCTASQAAMVVEDRVIPGPQGPVPIRIYAPESASSTHADGMVFFHGGGLVAGNIATHDAFCRTLAEETGSKIVSVHYRLAPEHKFPAAVIDACGAARWVVEHASELGIAPDRVGVGGDSAGATLAALTCQTTRQSGLRFAYQLLLCPILDYTASTASRRSLAADQFVGSSILEHDLKHYLPPGVPATRPDISPLRAQNVRNLPPAYIHTAEFDPLCDEGKLYADRLAVAGVETHYSCHAGMIHMFYALNRSIPYARAAMKMVGREIRAMQY